MKIMKQLTSALAISMFCFGSVSASDTEDLTAVSYTHLTLPTTPYV